MQEIRLSDDKCNNFNNFNEKLIDFVSRHKILYDSTAEGYSNFQAQDEIWRKIANELHEDVAAIKLKWKNIRSCYTRYLRQVSSQNCKITRTYYLAKQLRFLLPFCKPKHNSLSYNAADTRPTVETLSTEDISNAVLQYENNELELVAKTEPPDDDEDGQHETDHFDESNSEEVNGNKRQWETNSEHESNKKAKIESSDEAELNFFRSLLPDVRKMNGKQRNKLKIAILSAIDSILYSED